MSPRLDPYQLVGRTLERYSLEAFMGFGRFSALYRGTEVDTRCPVAIRVLSVRTTLPPSERPAVLQRLRASVATVQSVPAACPTFANVLDVGAIFTPEGQWMPGVVQSLVAGELRSTNCQTLRAVLAEERPRRPSPRTITAAIEWMTPLADALAHSHGCGLVHGNVAPQSIVVRDETTVQLLDLGMLAALALLQLTDRAFRTSGERHPFFFDPAFASPEHFASARMPARVGTLGPASDVFSLALVMLELLTGRAPLGDGNDAELEAAAFDPLVRPTPRARGRDLGGDVEAVFERALAVRATDRHGTVESFWSALRAAARPSLNPTVVSPPLSPPSSPTLADAFVARVRARGSIPPPWSSAMPPATIERNPRSDRESPGRARGEAGSQQDSPTPTPAGVVTTHGTAKAPVEDLVVGETIAGKYSVERLLGRGGMGTVWLCTHIGLGERVAVKVMSRKMANHEDVRARFAREARASAKIKSRYVARVFDTGELPDLRPYIVMEYMEGETLADALRGGKAMTLADTARILGQVGRGLARAHELGIVHRDIKPQNVFLAQTADDGVLAKLFDFGIVKVSDAAPNEVPTREGVLVGTPHYMSPEQADGLPIDARSDIFSLGVLAFRMMTGKRLFHGGSVMQTLQRIISAPLPNLSEHAPSVPPAVNSWFQRACARKREDRFGSAIECVEALARAAGVSFVSIVHLPAPETPEPVAAYPAPSARAASESRVLPGPAPGDGESPALEEHDLLPVVEEEISILELSLATDQVASVTNPQFGEVQRSVPPMAFDASKPALRESGVRALAGRLSLRWALAVGGFMAALGIFTVAFMLELARVPLGDRSTASAPAAAPPAPMPIPPAPGTPSENSGAATNESSVTSDAGLATSPPDEP